MATYRHNVILAVLIVGVPLIGLWLHYRAGLHFPYPWADETLYYFPALNFYTRWTPAAPELNGADGMFWMPDGYFVAMGLISHVTGASIEIFRHVSYGFSLIFYFALLGYVYRSKLKDHALIIPVVWLISPMIVAFSNYARPEPLIFALLGLFVAAVTFNRYIVAFCFLALGATVHPAGVAISGFFFLYLLLDFRSLRAAGLLRIGWLEGLFLLIATLAIAGQVAHWLVNLQEFLADMEIQFGRRGSRGYLTRLAEPGILFMALSAAALAAVYGLSRWLAKQNLADIFLTARIKSLLVMALALSVFAIYGAERNYTPYLYIFSPMFLVVALLELVEHLRAALPARQTTEERREIAG